MSEHDSADTSGCLPWLIGALVVLALLAGDHHCRLGHATNDTHNMNRIERVLLAWLLAAGCAITPRINPT